MTEAQIPIESIAKVDLLLGQATMLTADRWDDLAAMIHEAMGISLLMAATHPSSRPVDLRREFENPCPHLKTLSLRRSRGFYNHDQRSSEPTVSDSRGRVVRSLGMAQTLLRPEQVDDLVAQYREGATLVELASVFGVNRRTVAMHLTRREVTIRRGRFDPSRIHEAADLYLSGLTLVEVGVKVGAGPQAVRRALASHGVVIRPGGRCGSRITASTAVGG